LGENTSELTISITIRIPPSFAGCNINSTFASNFLKNHLTMNKLVLSIIALLAVAITFTACNSNSPKAAADKFLTSLAHMDYEAAKTVSTEDTKKMLDLMAQFSSMMPDSVKTEAKKIKITIKDEKIEGDNATVTYTSSEDENKNEHKLNLTKKDGQW